MKLTDRDGFGPFECKITMIFDVSTQRDLSNNIQKTVIMHEFYSSEIVCESFYL